MPKKVKLNIQDLKVQSFVTSLEDDSKAKVKGGLPYTCNTCDEMTDCSITYIWYCYPTETFEPNCRTACICTNQQATYCPCL
jgi:hypothetical protein